jgi:hypothetical protein
MNYLNEMKKFLKDLTTDLYNVRAEEVELDELPSHYFNMGYTIKRIEESTSMESIMNDVRMGRYEDIGFFYSTPEGQEPAVDQFLELFIDHIRAKDKQK